MGRFVRPEISTLTISHGDTLTVRRRLSAGEERARFARMSLAGVDGALNVNHLHVGLATITAYLIDWTLKDDAGQAVPIRDLSVEELSSTLDALDPDSFREIRQAIEAHEDAMQAERTAEKKGQDGGTVSSAISPSLSAAGGASSGFVN